MHTDANHADRFEDLVNRFRGAVFATALRMTGEFTLAEDATQETFIRLHGHLDNIDPDKIGGWLKVTARRLARDLVKRERVLPNLVSDVAAQEESSDEIERAEDTALALAGLASLPDAERDLLAAELLGGMTHDDMAAYFRISRTTLKGRLQRAHQRLAQAKDPQALVKRLALVGWPGDFVARCALSNEARHAAEQALIALVSPSKAAVFGLSRKKIETAHELCQRAVALNPHDARNHATLATVCVWLARADYLAAHPPTGLFNDEEMIGKLAGPAFTQAIAHARVAARLNPRDPDVCMAQSLIAEQTSPSKDDQPVAHLRELAWRALELAPLRLDIAAEVVFFALRHDANTGRDRKALAAFRRAIVAHTHEPITHYELCYLVGGILQAAVSGERDDVNRTLAEVRHRLQPEPSIRDEYEQALAFLQAQLDRGA